jgi:hypothetical protein
MSAPLSRPYASNTAGLWLRKLPGWICITSPSSRLILAISVSTCARNASASSADAAPASARSSSRWHAAASRSAVRAVGWPWSVDVAPIDAKNARRLRCAAR